MDARIESSGSSAVRAGDSGDAAASPSNIFLGQNWLDLGIIWEKMKRN